MGFFSSLFRQPTIVEDSFFGRLVLQSNGQYGSPYCYYAAKVMFRPTETAIECMLDTTGTGGPTSAQRDFFQYVESIYPTLLPAIETVVSNESRLFADGAGLVHFAKTHRLAGITLPEIPKSPVSWSIWFEPIDTSNWGYSIEVDVIDDVPQTGIGLSA